MARARRQRSPREIVNDYGTAECRVWRDKLFERFALLADDLARAYVLHAQAEDYRAANDWLRRTVEPLLAGPWNTTHDDDALIEHAKVQARVVETMVSSLSQQAHKRGDADIEALREALPRAQARVLQHELNLPDDDLPLSAQLARMSCPNWWRRQLRRLSGRRIEQVMRECGRVHRRAGIYCSDLNLSRRRSQQYRNQALLEAVEAINQHDERYTLAELSELGLANPENRRAELMLRIRETEEEARERGDVGMFFTLTCPSRFHPVVAKRCVRNRRYNGATPREAQAYLNALWARARAKLAREDIGLYGVRVVEPHHDGTPHWHMLVWMHPDDVPRVTEILRDKALEDTPDEPGAEEYRFDAERIDYSKGTATGYIAKYISKSINGEQFVDADLYGKDMTQSAPRIEAWAAVWGIRQFQFLGLPSVTVWRETRRLNEERQAEVAQWEAATHPPRQAAELMASLRAACNAGSWRRFLQLMGGPLTPRKLQPVRPWREDKLIEPGSDPLNRATGEESVFARGRYGESLKTMFGLMVMGTAGYLTRYYRWRVAPKGDRATPGGGEAADAWTCVNNCTGPDFTPREPDPETLAAQRNRYHEWITSPEMHAEQEAAAEEAEMARTAPLNLGVPRTPPQPAPDEFFPAGL